MSERCYLATFRPIIRTRAGFDAATRHGLPPFIDGSCRREPDLESPFPSMSASCRAGAFAPRLEPGDRVAYLTVKGTYLNDRVAGWRLVAVLRVRERFATHEAAASWYQEQGVEPPSNCFVAGNVPQPFARTNGDPPPAIKRRLATGLNAEHAVDLWDATYRARIREWPVLLACTPVLLDLNTPSQLCDLDLIRIFGRVPATQNPPQITRGQLARLIRAARCHVA
jgi:hypothetical protein